MFGRELEEGLVRGVGVRGEGVAPTVSKRNRGVLRPHQRHADERIICEGGTWLAREGGI